MQPTGVARFTIEDDSLTIDLTMHHVPPGMMAAFSNKFPGQKLELMRRVIYVHGVPSGTKLQSPVASLGTIPARVTVAIACGKIERSGQ
jgi:hypothetical protein